MAEVTYYFNSKSTSVWTDSAYFIDNILTNYASTTGKGDTEVLDGNTCPGTDLGIITKVELRAYGYGDGNDRIDLTPIFVAGTGDEHPTTPGTEAGWGAYVDITNDTNAPDWSSWTHIQTIDVHVEKDTVAGGATMYCAKVEIRVTWEEPWVPPESDIDVGADPIDRGSYINPGVTYIDKNNPANASGTLHTVQVHTPGAGIGLRVGTFYTTNGNTLKCRDSVLIGYTEAGFQTFTELSITVVAGDYIGCYLASGRVDASTIEFDGFWYVIDEYIDPNDEAEYGFVEGDAISLYGYGDIPSEFIPTVTII